MDMKSSGYSRANPSPHYQELLGYYKRMHSEGHAEKGLSAAQTFAGTSLMRVAEAIKKELDRFPGRKSLLDYGAGKGVLYQQSPLKLPNGESVHSLPHYWGLHRLSCYDPGYEPYSVLPEERFDAVIATDVMEHLPEEDIDWILDEIFSFAQKLVFLQIACYPALKFLPNGENAHATVRTPSWWYAKIEPHWHARPDLACQMQCDQIEDGRHRLTILRSLPMSLVKQ